MMRTSFKLFFYKNLSAKRFLTYFRLIDKRIRRWFLLWIFGWMGRPHLLRRQTIDVWLLLLLIHFFPLYIIHYHYMIIIMIIILCVLSLLQLRPRLHTQLAGGKNDRRRKPRETEWICLGIPFFVFEEREISFFLDDDVYSIFILSSFRHGPSSKNNKLPVHDRIISRERVASTKTEEEEEWRQRCVCVYYTARGAIKMDT